jgi:hypothetical protein
MVVLLALPFLLGAKGCSDKQCQQFKDAAVVTCAAQSDSMLCAEARRQAEACGAPAPGPTPTPTPIPTPTPTPIPPPEGLPASCVPDTTGWVHRPGPVINLGKVGIAIDSVRTAKPELFVEDGHRLAKGPAGIDEFFGLVADALRRGGTCAAQAHEGGELKDNVAVAVGDGAFEGWQLVEYGAGRLRDLVNACKAGEGGCTWMPPTGPVSDGCGDPAPPALFGFNVNEHHAFCATLNSTALVQGADYCASIGFTDGRSVCAVRVEGTPDREACERRLMRGNGKPLWSSNSPTLEVFPCGAPGGCACADFVNMNPFLAAHTGHGIAKVCDALGEHCGTVVIP